MNNLNQEFRRLRRSLHVSQTQLAIRTRMPQHKISLFENGKLDPRLSTVERLLNKLGYTLLPVPEQYLREFKQFISDPNLLQEHKRTQTRKSTARVFLMAPGEMDSSKRVQQETDHVSVTAGRTNPEEFRFIGTGMKVSLTLHPEGTWDADKFDDAF